MLPFDTVDVVVDGVGVVVGDVVAVGVVVGGVVVSGVVVVVGTGMVVVQPRYNHKIRMFF